MVKKKKGKSKVEEKLYKLNKKKPKKMNDNLIKLVADKELILSVSRKIQSNKGAMTVGVGEKDIVDGFSKDVVDEISEIKI